MYSIGIRTVALIALGVGCVTSMAQTYTRAQLEQQYQITCSAQNMAAAPVLRTECVKMRAMIDRIAAEGSLREDNEASSSLPRTSPAAPGGAIGDPGVLSRERVYDDQCVKKAPRTDAEREQCRRLYQAINPATNGDTRAAAARNGRGDSGSSPGSGGTPTDQYGKPCVTLTDQKLERWGNNNENTTHTYIFENGCNHAMSVEGQFSHTHGPERGAMNTVCPGLTDKLSCAAFSGKGCSQMIWWRVKPAPELTEGCRRR